MNSKCFKVGWWAAPLAFAVVGGGYVVARSHLETKNLIRSEEAASAILDHLAQDRQLNTVLKWIQAGDIEEAERRMNILLSGDIVSVNSQLASADEGTRSFGQSVFRKMAQYRPSPPLRILEGSGRTRTRDEMEAEKILGQAVAAKHQADATVPASR